jgi:hypothetical protein
MKTDYFATYSGQKIYYKNFSEDMVNISDIAHHLSGLKRYAGSQSLHMSYTVAQHSVLMAEWCYNTYQDTELAKLALLHDASEAYLGDVNSILKRLLPDYNKLESKIQSVILSKYTSYMYKLSEYDIIDSLDKAILVNEVKALFPIEIQKKYINNKEKGVDGVYVNPYRCYEDVKIEFLEWCNKLGIKDND